MFASLAAGTVVAVALVRLVMWRLAWLDRRPVTARMKRGDTSRWWLLILVLPTVGVVALWLGNLDAARWCCAVTCGAPFLFCTDKFWGAAK
ncbi:MAG: hypothetical protein JWO11_3544 [Nocardioides sp.]|nr:hypothetical protein [Nocardioides sp.]